MQADMLLHVVDAASPVRDEQIREVNKLLKEIGADNIPQILIFNKIDCAESNRAASYVRDEYGRITCIRLSAKTGEGLDFVKIALAEAIAQSSVESRERFLEVGI